MLEKWLTTADRSPAPYGDFEVVDVAEVDQLSDEVLDYVSDLLRDARVDPAFFRAAAEKLGWDEVDAWLEDSIPAGATARRGQFGEILSAAVLEEFHDYIVPVRKLRYAITAGQSLPSSDVLALLVDEDGEIRDVCFVEAKLRTGADTAFAAMGYRQLRDDYAKRLPDVLRFTGERLYENVDGLFDPFMAYLARRDDAGGDTFRLFLVQDVDAWSETTLENLDDEPVELDALTVHVVLLASLADLTAALFAGIGVTSVIDDV